MFIRYFDRIYRVFQAIFISLFPLVSRPPPVTYIPPALPDDEASMFEDTCHEGINFQKYEHIPVEVTGRDPVKGVNTFEEANLHEVCYENIRRAKYTKPTPVQKHAIPVILAKRDLMACAQTGSGKTVS